MILQTTGSLLVAAIGAALGWVMMEFVARPIRRFYDLRGEIIQRMAQYGNLRAPLKELPDGNIIEITPRCTQQRLPHWRKADWRCAT